MRWAAESTELTLRGAQRQVDAWMRERGWSYWQPLAQLARMTEELGEVARVVNHLYGEKPKKADEAEQDLGLEMADVLYGVAMAYIQNLMEHRVGMGGSLYLSALNLGSLVGILSPLLVVGYDQTLFILPALLCLIGAALLMLGDRTAQIQKRLEAEAA